MTLTEATRRRRSLERQLQAQRESAARVAGELQAAQRIQTAMLPRSDALRDEPRVDLAAAMMPAREVGGDLYDFFRLDGDRLFFLIGDVAGKGLQASIFMAVSKALYKSATLRMPDADIGALMSTANAEVSRENPERLFVSAFAGILDLRSGVLDYCNAGHDNPYLLHSGDSAFRRLEGGDGPPLCAIDDFDYRSAEYRMREQETVCLVTDGVIEARDPAGTLYGRQRLEAILARARIARRNSAAVVADLCDDAQTFSGGSDAADDLTVMVLRWNGEPRR